MWDWFGYIEYILTVQLVFSNYFYLNVYDKNVLENHQYFYFTFIQNYFYICIRK